MNLYKYMVFKLFNYSRWKNQYLDILKIYLINSNNSFKNQKNIIK